MKVKSVVFTVCAGRLESSLISQTHIHSTSSVGSSSKICPKSDYISPPDKTLAQITTTSHLDSYASLSLSLSCCPPWPFLHKNQIMPLFCSKTRQMQANQKTKNKKLLQQLSIIPRIKSQLLTYLTMPRIPQQLSSCSFLHVLYPPVLSFSLFICQAVCFELAVSSVWTIFLSPPHLPQGCTCLSHFYHLCLNSSDSSSKRLSLTG